MAKCSVPSLESLVIEMQQSKIGSAFFQVSLVSVLETTIQNYTQRGKKQVPHVGILCLKEMYKIIMGELLSLNCSSLHLWRETIMTEAHFGFSSVHLRIYQCIGMGTSVQPSTCIRLRRQNPNALSWLPSMAYSTPIFEGIAGRYMWIILWNIKSSPFTLRSDPQYLWPFLDYLLRCFTTFLFPTYKNYGIAPCQCNKGQ